MKNIAIISFVFIFTLIAAPMSSANQLTIFSDSQSSIQLAQLEGLFFGNDDEEEESEEELSDESSEEQETGPAEEDPDDEQDSDSFDE